MCPPLSQVCSWDPLSIRVLTRPLVASCWPLCASLVSWAASAELEPGAGSGVSNESRYVDNYKYYIYV